MCSPAVALTWLVPSSICFFILSWSHFLCCNFISSYYLMPPPLQETGALPRARICREPDPRQRLPLPRANKDNRQRAFADGYTLGKARLSAKASFAESLALGKDRLSAKGPRRERLPLSSPLPRAAPLGSRQRGGLFRAPRQALGKCHVA
jgi:hypothetical protein